MDDDFNGNKYKGLLIVLIPTGILLFILLFAFG